MSFYQNTRTLNVRQNRNVFRYINVNIFYIEYKNKLTEFHNKLSQPSCEFLVTFKLNPIQYSWYSIQTGIRK